MTITLEQLLIEKQRLIERRGQNLSLNESDEIERLLAEIDDRLDLIEDAEAKTAGVSQTDGAIE
jgi:hypothetical protein